MSSGDGAASALSPNAKSPLSVAERLKASLIKEVKEKQHKTPKDGVKASRRGGGTNANANAQSLPQTVGQSPLPPPPPPKPTLTGRQQNILRVVAQYLDELGLNGSLHALADETSGACVQSVHATRLQSSILTGHWDEALSILDATAALKSPSPLLSPQDVDKARRVILEAKFSDLLFANEPLAALKLLREDYPARPDTATRRAKMTAMLFASPQELSADPHLIRFKQDYSHDVVLEQLRRFLPPGFCVVPRRLERLMDQAHAHQKESAPLARRLLALPSSSSHNSANFVLRDHHFSAHNGWRLTAGQTISTTLSEVWVVEWSPNGKLLAAAGRDDNVYLWRLDAETRQLKKERKLAAQVEPSKRKASDGITTLSWSSDSRLLACAGTESCIEVTIFEVETGRRHRSLNAHANLGSTVSFFGNDSHKLVVGSHDKGTIQVYDLSSTLPATPSAAAMLENWEGFRVRHVRGLKDGYRFLAADSHNRIRLYDCRDKTDSTLLTEDSNILTFVLDASERYCVVTTSMSGLRLWDLRNRSLIRNFTGIRMPCENFVLPSITGRRKLYIASGDNARRVALWSADDPRVLYRMEGHMDDVNAVAFNPRVDGLLVSASDDSTLKLWYPKTSVTDAELDDEMSSSSSSASSTNPANRGPLDFRANRRQRRRRRAADSRSAARRGSGSGRGKNDAQHPPQHHQQQPMRTIAEATTTFSASRAKHSEFQVDKLIQQILHDASPSLGPFATASGGSSSGGGGGSSSQSARTRPFDPAASSSSASSAFNYHQLHQQQQQQQHPIYANIPPFLMARNWLYDPHATSSSVTDLASLSALAACGRALIKDSTLTAAAANHGPLNPSSSASSSPLMTATPKPYGVRSHPVIGVSPFVRQQQQPPPQSQGPSESTESNKDKQSGSGSGGGGGDKPSSSSSSL